MPNGIRTETITTSQVSKLLDMEEGQFSDLKDRRIAVLGLSKAISALANTDGGDLYIGITELIPDKRRVWDGFTNEEEANSHVQNLERLFPLATDFLYEFIKAEGQNGLVLHLQINKTHAIIKASNSIPYIRRGAQSLPVDTPEALKRLEFSKGITSFETELTNVPKDVVTESDVIQEFVREVVPTTTPEVWLRKQQLLRG